MNKPRLALVCVLLAAIAVANPYVHAAQDTDDGETVSIWVEAILVSPSEILTDYEIAAVVTPYERRELTVADLNEVVEQLNQMYVDKGFMAARAVLPPQTVEDGVIHVTLVEGRVGDVVVEGNQYTQGRFITDRMSLVPGDLLDVAQLESDLIFFNAVYDVQLVARLEPGEAFGTTDYIIETIEPKRWSTEVTYSNSSRQEGGANRVSVALANRGLFGRSDPVGLTMMAGAGAKSGAIDYAMPLESGGGKLHLSYHQNYAEARQDDLSAIEVVVDSSGGGVGWSQPLGVQPGVNVKFTVDYRWHRSRTMALGAQLVDQFQTSTTYGIISEMSGSNHSMSVRHAMTSGVYRTQIGDTRFAKYWGDYTRQWRWGERYTLSSRVRWQMKYSGVLPTSEFFTLGGGTVRGLSPNAVSGENGYALSLEIRRPLSEALETLAFVDHGGVFSHPGGGGNITSVGVGADIRLFRSLTGSLVYALPLGQESANQARGRLDVRVTLSF